MDTPFFATGLLATALSCYFGLREHLIDQEARLRSGVTKNGLIPPEIYSHHSAQIRRDMPWWSLFPGRRRS